MNLFRQMLDCLVVYIKKGSLSVLLLVVPAGILYASAASGSDAKRSFSVAGYDKVEMNSVASVRITQGKDYAAQASGATVLVDNLDIKMNEKEKTLSISDKKNISTMGKQSVMIDITAPVLESVKHKGIGNVDIKGPFALDFAQFSGVGRVHVTNITGDKLTVLHKGVGHVALSEINVKACYITSKAVGSITLSGACKSAMLSSKGVGSIDARELTIGTLELLTNGLGRVKVK